jgi:hypothetical protein
MKKSIKVAPKKRRGRPATGKDPHIAARMPPGLISEVKAWAAANSTTRSDAFRRLVEIGLTVKSRPKQTSRARADQANAMAGNQLDELVDVSASAEEQASRKRRLLRGPEEFQGVRVDRPAKEKS